MAHKNRKKIEQQSHRGPTFHGFAPKIEDHEVYRSRHPRKSKYKKDLRDYDE